MADSALKSSPVAHTWPAWFEHDPRWQVALRIAASRYFARSRHLSRFLLYIVGEAIENRTTNITEHHIGVHVFDRPPDYRSIEDNIVRTYARQLRRRLADYFASEGRTEAIRIEIPLGGYVPRFINENEPREESAGVSHCGIDLDDGAQRLPEPLEGRRTARGGWLPLRGWLRRSPPLRGILFAAYTLLLAGGTWLIAWRALQQPVPAEPARPIWDALFTDGGSTYIVPPDSGFNLLEDMSRSSLSQAEYIKGASLDLPDIAMQQHADQDLRTQQYTDFASMQIVAALARQHQYNPQRVLLRFPRDLRLNDLKASNAIIIGSASSNPWAGLFDGGTNFHIVPSADMVSASIVNARPLKGEAAIYASHWNEPAHETYALILFVPNLTGNGHVLVIEGLDVAGTQAAAELLFRPGPIASIIRGAQASDGSIRPFEILLRATSIQSSSEGTQIIATRVH